MLQEKLVLELEKQLKIKILLEVPPNSSLGDFSLPCFVLAKEQKKNPVQIAKEIAQKFKKPDFVKSVIATGPYVNFFIDTSKIGMHAVQQVLMLKDKFGKGTKRKGEIVAIDYSSPNIGKPFHFGHLRSTIIGESIARMIEFQSGKVLRLNYLGDWGTQFGKLIYSYLQWGDKKKLSKEPVKHLLEIYVKFHDEAKKNPELEDEGRKWFAKLEQGDSKAKELWAQFRSHSIKEFERIYKILGSKFDSYNGEEFSSRRVPEALEWIKRKKVAELDDGALVAKLPGFEIPFMLVKSDGSTTYGSRDVATALYRLHDLKATHLMYVVDQGQSLHFSQLFAFLDKMGHSKEKMTYVAFGLYLGPDGKKIASRTGKSIFMSDVLSEAIELAEKTIEEKNPKLANKKKIAQQVAVGAILFADLLTDRVKDVTFDLMKILSFEGDTGPYLMYTHARAASVVRKAKEQKLKPIPNADVSLLNKHVEEQLLKLILEFPKKAEEALASYKPHIAAQYLIEFSRTFNEFYHSCPCLSETDKNLKIARLTLIEVSRQVIENGLYLLGIEAIDEM